jgi:4-hydroxy-2-oxoheptanedioate aldolase
MTEAPDFTLASRLRAGETIFTGWCGLGLPLLAETLAREGFSAVTLDQQHGAYDVATSAQAIAGIRHAGAAPVVRVPLGDFATAARMLDLGAEGVIAPMINTVADARTFVSVMKYPPLGERSWGPTRAVMLTGLDQPVYFREANALTLTFAMIETRQALENVEAIAAVPGIDALFVGPYDLAIALSNGTSQDPQSPDVEKALDVVVAAANKAGKIPGLYCANADRALATAKRGFRFLAVGSELGMLRAGAAEQMKKLKGA